MLDQRAGAFVNVGFNVVVADSGWLTSVQTYINQHPDAVAVRAGLTLLIVFVAIAGGRWLAGMATAVPVRVDTKRLRAGKITGKTKGRQVEETHTGLSRWLGRLTLASVWIAAAVALVIIWSFDQSLTNSFHPDLEQLRLLAAKFIGSLVVLASALGLGRILQSGFVSSVGRGWTNPNLTLLGGRVIYVTVLIIGFIIILSIWGTGIVLPVALVGTLTVALSLALQDVLKNLVAGVYLIIERPFVIGEQIAISTYVGVVRDIQIRYTALDTDDGQRVVIPNSMLFSSVVVNMSARERRRAGLVVTVPDTGAESVDRAEDQIRTALDAVPGVLENPTPQVILNRASAGKVDLHVVFWMPSKNFSQNATVFSDVIEQVRAQVQGAEVAVLDPATSPV